MSEITDLIGYIKGKIRAYVASGNADPFETFFKDALFFNAEEAPLLSCCYRATCEVFEITPGLGVSKASVQAKAKPVDLKGEFAKVGLGKFSTGPSSIKLETRLSDYFGAHPSNAAAKKALTPAKRDALKAEAGKLLKIPPSAWRRHFDSGFVTFGVRG